jgi:hypothetical protein
MWQLIGAAISQTQPAAHGPLLQSLPPGWLSLVSATIALGAFILSVLALLTSRSDKRHELHLSEILKAVQDLEDHCSAFASAVENNVLFRCHPGPGDHSDCYRKATLMYRDAAAQLELVEKLIPPAAEHLFREFKEWHTDLTDTTTFPVQSSADALAPGDPRVATIRNAQKAWNSYLCDIRISCLSRRMKFWKRLGLKPSS